MDAVAVPLCLTISKSPIVFWCTSVPVPLCTVAGEDGAVGSDEASTDTRTADAGDAPIEETAAEATPNADSATTDDTTANAAPISDDTVDASTADATNSVTTYITADDTTTDNDAAGLSTDGTKATTTDDDSAESKTDDATDAAAADDATDAVAADDATTDDMNAAIVAVAGEALTEREMLTLQEYLRDWKTLIQAIAADHLVVIYGVLGLITSFIMSKYDAWWKQTSFWMLTLFATYCFASCIYQLSLPNIVGVLIDQDVMWLYFGCCVILVVQKHTTHSIGLVLAMYFDLLSHNAVKQAIVQRMSLCFIFVSLLGMVTYFFGSIYAICRKQFSWFS